MDVKAVVSSQYGAALRMLEQVAEACPDEAWFGDAPGDAHALWQVAYHALFYTHLYLQESDADFVPWPRQRGESQYLGNVPWPPQRPAELGAPYSQAEVLEYAAFCRAQVAERVAALDLAAASGFDWLPMNKLELQLYNIRHLMQHTGALMERLTQDTGIEVNWIGMG
jgi:hypothetical protein